MVSRRGVGLIDMKKEKLIVISGPTASGKTELAIKLCEAFNGEIISADSRQIYKEMNIATAKVIGEKEMIDGEPVVIYKNIPHYLIDIIHPDEEYHLAKFQKDVYRIADKIIARGKTPFLVGGTGLYIQSIVDNFDLPVGEPNLELRAQLEKKLEDSGLIFLSKELETEFPNLANSVNLENPRHVLRAVEIGKQFGDITKEKKAPLYEILQLAITIDREELYNRINTRVDKMLELGVLEETKQLMEKYDTKLSSMTGIGYRQLIMYIKGETSLEEAIELFKRDTRRYAKRQLTWFRRDERIIWVEGIEDASLKIRKFITNNQ